MKCRTDQNVSEVLIPFVGKERGLVKDTLKFSALGKNVPVRFDDATDGDCVWVIGDGQHRALEGLVLLFLL